MDSGPGTTDSQYALPIAVQSHPGLRYTSVYMEELRAHFEGIFSAGPSRAALFRLAALLPGVPTIAETAIPGFDVNTWLGALMPAGTPERIVSQFNAAIVKALELPEVRERLRTAGAEPIGSSPAQLAAYLKSELSRWTTLARTVKFEMSN